MKIRIGFLDIRPRTLCAVINGAMCYQSRRKHVTPRSTMHRDQKIYVHASSPGSNNKQLEPRKCISFTSKVKCPQTGCCVELRHMRLRQADMKISHHKGTSMSHPMTNGERHMLFLWNARTLQRSGLSQDTELYQGILILAIVIEGCI